MSEPSPKELRKWQELRGAQEKDFKSPLMQRLGHYLSLLCNGNDQRVAALAMAMARDCVAYESDIARVGAEDLDNPDNVWRRGVDDCDGKARLFVALCRAADVRAELVPKWQSDPLIKDELWLQHVSARALVNGQWQPAELTLKRAQLGEAPSDVPKETGDGKWLR